MNKNLETLRNKLIALDVFRGEDSEFSYIKAPIASEDYHICLDCPSILSLKRKELDKLASIVDTIGTITEEQIVALFATEEDGIKFVRNATAPSINEVYFTNCDNEEFAFQCFLSSILSRALCKETSTIETASTIALEESTRVNEDGNQIVLNHCLMGGDNNTVLTYINEGGLAKLVKTANLSKIDWIDILLKDILFRIKLNENPTYIDGEPISYCDYIVPFDYTLTTFLAEGYITIEKDVAMPEVRVEDVMGGGQA